MGLGVSAVRAFLRPALSRPNLTLLLNTNVVKLNFKGTRCVGVKLMTDGAVKDIAADKEVILAAGAINSPKLLMLSGVGEAKALRSRRIPIALSPRCITGTGLHARQTRNTFSHEGGSIPTNLTEFCVE